MIKKTSTPSTVPECGCAFIGGTYLTTPYLGNNDKIKGVGTGDYEMSFDFIFFTYEEDTLFGAVRIGGDYGGFGIYLDTNPGDSLILSSNVTKGTIYHANIKRVSGVTTISIDGAVSASGNDARDWSVYDTAAQEAGVWKLFYGHQYPDVPTQHAYRISNFKFYKAGTLIIDLPLIENTNEIENNLEMTTVEINRELYFCNGIMEMTSASQGKTVYNAGGWALYPSDLAAAGDATSSLGVNKAGCNLYFPCSLNTGCTIESAKLLGVCSVLNVGSKGKISAYRNNTPVQITSLADYLAHFSEKTTARIAYEADKGASYYFFQSSDIKDVLQEVLNLGNINNLELFVEDHDGLSSADKYQIFQMGSLRIPFILFNYR